MIKYSVEEKYKMHNSYNHKVTIAIPTYNRADNYLKQTLTSALNQTYQNLEIVVEVVETKEKKYEEELAEDIMKILTCYSARFYGRRGGRKKKNKAENEPVESNAI